MLPSGFSSSAFVAVMAFVLGKLCRCVSENASKPRIHERYGMFSQVSRTFPDFLARFATITLPGSDIFPDKLCYSRFKMSRSFSALGVQGVGRLGRSTHVPASPAQHYSAPMPSASRRLPCQHPYACPCFCIHPSVSTGHIPNEGCPLIMYRPKHSKHPKPWTLSTPPHLPHLRV